MQPGFAASRSPMRDAGAASRKACPQGASRPFANGIACESKPAFKWPPAAIRKKYLIAARPPRSVPAPQRPHGRRKPDRK